MPDPNLEILVRDTYKASIKNSVGSTLFRSLYAKKNDTDEVIDITKAGEYSCAFFVSSLLYLAGLIDKQRATVTSLENFCKNEEKWKEIRRENVAFGDVVFWEKRKYDDGSEHAHVGFILNTKEAVSTSDKKRAVLQHLIDYEDRKATAFYSYNWD